MPENGSNLTIKEIKFAQWLLEKRPLFKRLLILALIIINLIIWGIALYQFYLFLIYQKNYQETLNGLTKNWVDFQSYHQRVQPAMPIIGDPAVIYLGQDANEPSKSRYDFIVEIENPNENWVIHSLDGQFNFEGQILEVKSSRFLPYEKKYLFSLNQLVESRISGVSFEINNINWQRLRPKMRERLDISKNLVFEEIKFIPPSVAEQKIAPARIQFKATNKSAYSFWRANLQIVIYQGRRIVDFYNIPLKNWLANQSQAIEITLLKPIEFASEIKVIPDVDLLAEDIFIKP
ncbi:MAG: hypothetical protein ACP5IX_01635 [Patescibacteria group bacterium]